MNVALARPIVWLASFPKSGNTWLRLLIANLRSGRDDAVGINDIEDTLAGTFVISGTVIEEITLIDPSLLTVDEIDCLRPDVIQALAADSRELRFMKIHDGYRRTARGQALLGQNVARAALYVVRDPRDIVLSFAAHNGRSIDWAIDRLNDPDHTLARRAGHGRQVPQRLFDWSGHVASWTEQRDVPLHVVRYEDLCADPLGTFERAVAFLGLDAPPAALARAVRFTDFAALQRQERDLGFLERPQTADGLFFRIGRPGTWCDTLTPAQHDAILAVHRPTMARFGYV